MKRQLIISIDYDQDPARIEIQSAIHAELNIDVVQDIGILCEAVCALIHTADQAGIKDSSSSLRDCIKHLEDGFADSSYETSIQRP